MVAPAKTPEVAPVPAKKPTPPRAGGLAKANDFAAALKVAAEQKRDILVLFHGSDWCREAENFKAKVWESAAFEKELGDGYVLVAVDRLQTGDEDPTRGLDNKKLTYSPPTYPTIACFDADGRMTGSVGGPELRVPAPAVAAKLDAIRMKREERDRLWALADSTNGFARAEAIGAGLVVLGQGAGYKNAYRPKIEELKKLDPDGRSASGQQALFDGWGLVNKARDQADEKKYDETLRWLDEEFRKSGLTPEQKQWVLAGKFAVYRRMEGQHTNAVATLAALIQLDPETDIAAGAMTYRKRIDPLLSLATGWKPEHIERAWVPRRVDLQGSVKSAGRYEVTFQWLEGRHALEIRNVALLAGGRQLALDVHDGSTGHENKDNTYILAVPAVQGPLELRFECRGAGGTDSTGSISLRRIDG